MVAILKVDNHNFLYNNASSIANVSVANVAENARCPVAYIIAYIL